MNFPTIKQLRYLVTLEETLHFSKAAERCFVSQSAFSTAIKGLEDILGVQLVDRSKKHVVITAAGNEVVSMARLCLRDLDLLVQSATQHSKPLCGPLYLGVIPTIAPFLLPKITAQLKKTHANLQLFLRENFTDELLLSLKTGKLDLALIALPYPTPNMETLVLFKDKFMLACRSDTKLVDPKKFQFNRLTGDSVLLLEDGHCLRDHALAACSLQSGRQVSTFSATSLLTLIQMVNADLGVTFLPEMAEKSTLLSGTQTKLYPLRQKAHRDVALVWRQGSAREKEFREIGALIKEAAAAQQT